MTADSGASAVPAPPATLRAFAAAVLEATTLAGKLAPAPAAVADVEREGPPPPAWPGRPAELLPCVGPAPRVPPAEGMPDPLQRIRILHAFANHELQAIELFAYGLLAFPEAPEPFRRGLLGALEDEQRHLQLYLGRLAALGARFGDHPVSAWLWGKRGQLATPLRFVAVMGLTFEGANLDHSLEHAAAARAAGDEATALVLERIHADEVRHVRFATHWLGLLKEPGESLGEAWARSLEWPLRPSRGRGRRLQQEARRAAGFDDSLLALLRAEGEEAAGGA